MSYPTPGYELLAGELVKRDAEIERHIREKVELAGLVAKERARIERLRAAIRGAQEALGEGEWIAASDILFDALAKEG